ncbi:MAG: TnpV protein [Clostridia bacterium]|nr:TnpV protein [Clostridia bacterium]
MKNEITYTEHNGLYYPNFTLPEQTNYTLGKYANLRLDFMKKHRRGTYTTLLTEGRLNEYIHEIDLQAHTMLNDIIPRLAQERGIDEDLKAHNALQWTAEMNNIKASAEEVVLREVVYQ